MMQSNLATSIDHTKDEEPKHARDHDAGLDIEEPLEVIWTQEREWHMRQPEQKECQHSSGSDTYARRDMVGDVAIPVPKYGTQHVANQSRSGVQLHSISNNGESSSGTTVVQRTPHPENGSGHNGKANVVDTAHSCSCKLSKRAYDLG